MTKTKEIKLLTKWMQKEMRDFILPIEKKTHICLVGERFHIENSFPLDIMMMSETLYSLPDMEMKKAMLESYIMRPLKCGIIVRYPEVFTDEEVKFAKMILKSMGLPIDTEKILIPKEDFEWQENRN